MGLWLLEVFSVVYHGHEELKPNMQIGTIKVNDGVNNQYIYRVKKTTKDKPSIQRLDEIVLTGPRLASISAKDSITIDVDLFSGAYKDSLCITRPHKRDSINVCFPLEKRIASKDGRGEIILLYAIYDSATEAHVEVKCLADNGFTSEVYGVVAASATSLGSFQYSTVLFFKKPSEKIIVGRCKRFPLSRSIVAVPLYSKLVLDIHLMTGDEHDFLEGNVMFQAKRAGTSIQLVDGKNCKIQVKVTWKCA